MGLGESKQKLFYLPEPYTDFIFAIIGEELGLVGAIRVVALFALLIWRGLRVGLRAPDAFGSYLALGLTIMLATQTLVNLGRGDGRAAHQGAAAAVHLLRGLGAPDDACSRRACSSTSPSTEPATDETFMGKSA